MIRDITIIVCLMKNIKMPLKSAEININIPKIQIDFANNA